jgi:hypothetical protein
VTRREKERNAYWGLVGKAEGKTRVEIILKWVLKKEAGKTLTGLILGQEPVCCYRQGNVASFFIKCVKFLE